MHHISKNWEHVFDFQYKVVTGQCVWYLSSTTVYSIDVAVGSSETL